MSKEVIQKKKKPFLTIREMVFTALFAVIIVICAQIQISVGPVPFTLQTFAMFLALGILGGKCGFFATLVYLLLGMIGVPVFAGFTGGIGTIASPSFGYIVGFVCGSAVYWILETLIKGQKDKWWFKVIGMVAALIVCYVIGTTWFMIVYSAKNGAVTLVEALGWCVFPFIPIDVAKLAVAVALAKALEKPFKKIALSNAGV